MTTRRRFLLAGVVVVLSAGHAGAQTRPVRIGILAGLPRDNAIATPPIIRRLAELGYREGAGMALEYRHTASIEGVPALARELIDRKCDLIFAVVSAPIARAFRDARTTIPVVFIAAEYDPIEKGIITSLRRPGGNMTGVYTPLEGLMAKRVEIAQETIPGASRFLVLSDMHTGDQLAALRKAAAARRVQLTVVEYDKAPYDFSAAFEVGRRERVHGVLPMSSPEFAGRRKELAQLLVSQQLPAFSGTSMAGEPGSLVSYYIDFTKLARRAAEIGVQILKGAKPGDIPVEQSAEFELVVNLRTAKALGVKIPYSVMARATRLIE